MPPIPIYSHSPINAAKAAGPSPQTADTARNMTPPPGSNLPTTTAAHLPGPAPAAASQPYPPAQPGASPAIPAPTGSAQRQYSPLQPTPTQPLSATQGPPAPQPGAVPIPPGSAGGPPKPTSTLPPPPKAGEAVSRGPGPTAAPQVPYPPQMHMPPPTGSSLTAPGAQRGTSTAFVAPAAGPSPLEHPPGYQQNVDASELDRYQRERQHALEEEWQRQGSLGGNGEADGEGVWDSARKMMVSAGEKLSAAESEVWKRINKGE